jgi:hypothetical protein
MHAIIPTAGVLLLFSACTAGVDETASHAAESVCAPAVTPARAVFEEESVAEAREPISPARGVCIGAVSLGAALGCVTATSACAGTSVITVGGTVYPCLIVLAVACAAVPTSAALYVEAFCPKV